MIEIGQFCELEVVKRVDFGVYLDAEELGDVLLPKRYVPEECNVGDFLHVFLYLDSEDRPIATTQQPWAKVGQFAYLKVGQTTEFGAFLEWGLDKQLLVPFAEQHRKMEVGKSYIVYVYLDKRDGRIVASSKIDKFIDDDAPHTFKQGDQVNLIIANSTDVGIKAIINHQFWGVLNRNEVFQRISYGQVVKGFIQYVRPDGKLNLTLNGGHKSRDKNSGTILQHLKENNGFAPLHDKTDPAIIKAKLNMSKAAFKKAIGGLYKQKIIVIEDGGIRLLDKG